MLFGPTHCPKASVEFFSIAKSKYRESATVVSDINHLYLGSSNVRILVTLSSVISRISVR